MGILWFPLNFWSQETLKQIGDQCGGFIETKEEEILKSHLHWDRVKAKGDGKLIPTEIEVTSDGLVYTIPKWVEVLVSVRIAREKKKN